jgi:putative spermidine/putrescine transport system permease protein
MMMFNRFDLSLEEASRVLGANEWVTFRRVTLPLIMPGVMTSALFGFTLSFDEYIRSFFATGSSQSLPLVILSSLTARITPTVYALGTLTTLVSLTLIAAFVTYLAVGRRRNRRPADVAPAEPANR